MTREAIAEAAALLLGARRSGVLVERLPPSCRPANVAEALAIQDAVFAALGDGAAGWKVGAPVEGTLVRGILLRSRAFASPARIPAQSVPMLGVEAEIAFRFERDMPPRERDYDYAEVAAAVTALPAIEIVDSRFRSYRDTPLLDRVADFVSNGAFVAGNPQPRWREHDLSRISVRLVIDGELIASGVGGHPAGDPLLPAVLLVNALREKGGVGEGAIATTGTYTGLNYAKPGQTVTAAFTGFGAAEVHFTD